MMGDLRGLKRHGCGKSLMGLMLLGAVAVGNATGLYETGPSQDSSFVRFVNGTSGDITVHSAKSSGKLPLGTQANTRVSTFQPIRAGQPLEAYIKAGSQQIPVKVMAKPGEFITVAAVTEGAGKGAVLQMRETPNAFSASKASIAAFNFDGMCASAQVDSEGKTDGVLKSATLKAVQRRMVSPVKATVQVSCAGKAMGVPLNLGQLEAGERYSIFVLPQPSAPIAVKDAIESGP